MSKQRPTADHITNELAGASAFFQRPVPAPVQADPEPTPPPATPTEAAPTQPQPLTITKPAPAPQDSPRTPRTPVRRQMIRHPFELYMDQLDSLRELAEAQRRRGEPASMSRMVREALDQFLDQQNGHTS